MKKIFKTFFNRGVFLTSAIVVATLAFVAPVSCRMTDDSSDGGSSDTSAPVVEDFSVKDPKTFIIFCTEKIILDNIQVVEYQDGANAAAVQGPSDENEEGDSLNAGNLSSLQGVEGSGNSSDVFAQAQTITYSEDGKSAEIEISAEMDNGKTYVFSGTVYDTAGNSLEFSQKVISNSEPARLVFNEVRYVYESSSQKTEYVEFFVIKGGNTAGLEYVSASNGEELKYEFPSINVKAGDYITLHGRTYISTTKKNSETGVKEDVIYNIEGWADEIGDDLSLSKAVDSCDTARDLWIEGDKKICTGTDILIIRNSLSSAVVDVLLVAAKEDGEWSKKLLSFINETGISKIWESPENQATALLTKGATTINRSISRQNTNELFEKYKDEEILPEIIPTSAADWLVTDKTGSGKSLVSGATPGYENSSNPYVK
ncbi:MAG: hypothetical protein IJ727_01445 [Treponema sp.]|nr:hypothetical protein [Treponema sp.]